MDEVEVVVAHSQRATLRVGQVFLKVDGDPAHARAEQAAMALAPVPTPKVLWHQGPVLALAAVPGTALGVLGAPGDALFDLAILTLEHEERLGDLLAGYVVEVDRGIIRTW